MWMSVVNKKGFFIWLLGLIFTVLLSLCVTAAIAATQNSVSTDGSTSMEKVIGALGEAFEQENPGITFSYNPTGSGAGITAVLEGRCDIGLSSRALKASEVEKGLTETVLALDGIAIIVNNENSVTNLTLEDLTGIYTGKITSWDELGGSKNEIVVIGREAGSGTRDGFESVTNTKDTCKYRQELTATGDVIAAVSQNPNAIGYTSLASVKKTVKVLSINGVTPNEETVRDGSYAIQRPFVLVTRKDIPLHRAAQTFFDFVTSPERADILTAVGVVAVFDGGR